MQDTRPLLFRAGTDFPSIRRGRLETLQVNLGYRCNQSCSHCHVNAGPTRTEMMDDTTLLDVISALDRFSPRTLDVTGGAPELHPGFRRLVTAARERGIEVIDRCNLTILSEPGQEDLAGFLAENAVRVVASLPCYTADNVDKQRGRGVFDASIEGLRRLNALGYGVPASGRVLDLVYNPGGAFLPPPQAALQADYQARLKHDHGVVFNQLLTLTNMPISRFGATLAAQGTFEAYMTLLRAKHDPANVAGVMCRSTLSVDWQGQLYDCDFNQMLGLPAGAATRLLRDLNVTELTGAPIAVANHCFGCTAGQGSSCGGALSA